MKIHGKYLIASCFLLALNLLPVSTFATTNEPCAAFKDAHINPSLIATMLKAAEDGHLYQIKVDSSKMGFCVDSPLGMVSGNFQQFDGGIALKEPSNHTLVSIDVNSLETDLPLTEKLLKGDTFFNAENYPEMIFISTGFEWLSETRGVLKGDLSMHGVTRAIAFYVEIIELDAELGDADTILVKATTTVQRSQFDMSTLAPYVSDRVKLCMSVEAERYKSL